MLQAVSATLVACHCRSCNAMGFAVVVGVCGAGAKDESQWAHGATGDNHEIYIYIYVFLQARELKALAPIQLATRCCGVSSVCCFEVIRYHLLSASSCSLFSVLL